MARVVLILALLPVAPAWAQEAPPRVVAFGGVEWSRFGDVTPLEEEGQTTTGFASSDSGFDLALGAEIRILPWLGVGVAHELQQSFDVDDFRGFSNRLHRVFDPSVTELYAAPSWPPADRIRLTGLAGVGFWRADESNTLALSFEGVELSRRELMGEHSGATLVVGVGVDVWIHRSFGVRAGYKYLRLSADDVEQPVHNLRALALFGFGG
jgi:opacity protein-like surface antigen